ncbi:MAG: N-6 DNA methylase [Candidatus Methylumidiphilus sp.]
MAKVKSVKEVKDEPLEKQLWKSADKLRKNIDAAEYKHVVLGLIFLKYISDSFEELFAKLQSGEGEYEGADPEDRDEYKSENVFFVPPEARWSFLLAKAKQPTIGTAIDAAMDAIESEKFVAEHQGRLNDISIYGQKSNQTTWRLAKMNLAIRGIDSSQVKWNNEGSFLNDMHKDLKADFIIANPPFNDSDWSGELLRNDGRWQYGTPPAGNANYAWLQHFIYHLSPTGKAGVALSKGALTSKSSGEGDIRKNLIADGNLIDCIVNLPAKLFLNTQIPAGL